LIVGAIQTSDYPVVQAGIIVIASSIVLANTVVDISYRFIDPRIQGGNL
jgi:peptide/nickel transport system permease protein